VVGDDHARNQAVDGQNAGENCRQEHWYCELVREGFWGRGDGLLYMPKSGRRTPAEKAPMLDLAVP